MRKLLAILIVCVFIWGVTGAASAQSPNRTLIALGAYKGIIFNNMFDEMKPGKKGMSMETLVIMLKANLQSMETDPLLVIEKVRIGEILAALNEVEQELAADPDAGKKSVRAYYEADQEPNHGKFMKMLKDKNFENMGLTFPFLGYNSANNGHEKFRDMLQNHPEFLAVLGGMTYADFYSHTADEPWVTEAVMAMLDAMHGVHLLGSIPVFLADQNCDCDSQEAEVSPDTIWPKDQTRANNMCCNRTTRKCVSYAGMNCLICNQSTGACCLAQPWCP